MAVPGDFAANTPNMNYYTLAAGDHAASCEAAAAAYQALADALAAEIATMNANTAATAAEAWEGLGGTAMTMTAGMFSGVLGLAVAYLNVAFGAAGDIATAYNAALTAMIPGPVCDNNRADHLSLAMSNVLNQNWAPMEFLDGLYGEYWMQNASMMGTFQAAVASALAVLATPPPLSPPTGNPATAAAAASQVAADPAINALSQSGQGMTEALGGGTQAASQAGAGGDAMQTAMPMLTSTLGQAQGLISPATQGLSSLPQMVSQGAGQMSGLLGPLSNAGSMGGATPAELAPIADVGAGPAGAGLNSLGGGLGGAVGPSNGVLTAFTKPVNSFSPPTQPRLPGAWKVAEDSIPAPVSGSPGGAGGGGLYGAPSALSRANGGGQGEKTPGRTMQLTGRTAVNEGVDRRN
jgi:PPE-repeat protein